MAVAKPRPYRRILTSALHRRFVHASALSLLVCYIISVIIGEKISFFWSWFPVGACGIRAILLFVSSLAVFVLRVGQVHIGPRTTTSPLATFRHLFPLHVAQTFGWYLFSAWWFSEVYVWSAPADADLGWVKPGRPHERASLNERPIYLHTYHMLLALVQAVAHLYFDYDRVHVPVCSDRTATDPRTHQLESVSRRIRRVLPRWAILGLAQSTLTATVFPLVYTVFFRRATWSFTLYFAKLFWNFSRSAAEPPGRVPSVGLSVLLRSFVSGGLLLLCWQTTNVFFSIFIGKEPLKRGQPLTMEAKDPNGSLLNGLKAQKEVVKTFAFWELCLISQQCPDRRKAIFSDIDREDGAAWAQILDAATHTIKEISVRIEEAKNPSPAAKPTAQVEAPQPEMQELPRLTQAPPKDGNIFAASPQPSTRQAKIGQALSSTAKSYGQSPDWTPTARARVRNAFDRASGVIMSPERKQKLLAASSDVKLLTAPSTSKPENLHPLVAQILRSPAGFPFRQTYARRLCGVVLGRPYGALCPIVDAIESLTRLLVASLEEDPYGKVQGDVSTVVRLFTDTVLNLEPFARSGSDIHWTDVYFPSASRPEAQDAARRVPEVEQVLATLKKALADLLYAFDPYLAEVKLAGKDLRLAKEAAGLDGRESDSS